jgi:hypothetical protein
MHLMQMSAFSDRNHPVQFSHVSETRTFKLTFKRTAENVSTDLNCDDGRRSN